MGLIVTGSGEPVTVAAHGLGASVAETRPLLSGVSGSRVFYEARGHDGNVPAPFTYRDLGDDLLQVADTHGATRALGVSMGSGALWSLLSRSPTRFDRVVSFLPAALDRPRADEAVRLLEELAVALEQQDVPAVERLVAAELPPEAQAYVRTRAAFLLANPGIAVAVRSLPYVTPVADRSALAAVSADVLVLAQESDPLHPAQVARDLVAVLPKARLVVFDQPHVVFRERARLRALVQEFLND
ncbi:MAG: alpha/beta hydrolase [Actinobacteria bacterium]|nr:alpha/beta hydrolase [Actinomycetota bacterium]MCA1721253.1 alpha/beta hydrolase [Actinomycetota bacterium]